MIITEKNETVTVSDGSRVGLLLLGGALLIGGIVFALLKTGRWILNPLTGFELVFFTGLTVLMLTLSKRTDVTINPAAKSVAFRTRCLFSSKEKTIPLSAVTHVHLRCLTAPRGPTSYQLHFSTTIDAQSFQVENERSIKNALVIFESLKKVLPGVKFDADAVVAAYESYQRPHLIRNFRAGLHAVPGYSWLSLVLGSTIIVVVPRTELWNRLAGGNFLWIAPFIVGGGLLVLAIISFLQAFFGDLTETIMRPFQ